MCCVLAGACSSDDTANPPATTTTVRGSVADSGSAPGWRAYGHDYANTRRNPNETRITAATVSNLRRAWSKDGLTGVVGTPAVVDGVAYFGDRKGTVWAVRAATGEAVWDTPVPGGFIVAAPAIDGDALFIG